VAYVELPKDADCIGLLNLDKVKIDPALALQVPASLALRRQVLPFALADGYVHVACANMLDAAALQAVEKMVAAPIRVEPAEPDSLKRALDRVYSDLQVGKANGAAAKSRSIDVRSTAELHAEDNVALCDELFHAAVLRQASDIHIDPEQGGIQVRFRVDGNLEEYRRLPAALQSGLISRLKVLCDEAGCSDPAALPEVERRWAEADQLDRELASLEDHLMRLSGGGSLEHLAGEAAAVSPDELPGRIEQLGGQIRQLETQRQELSEKIGGEEKTLQSMQASCTAVEAAEEVQDVLARLEGGVTEYVRLRLAAAVLRQGVERYRRKNEGPVLRRASELFRGFTLGGFERLSADCDEQGQKILHGVRADGRGSVALSGMSEGTADQLYLALRLASLASFFENREPFPLIVDDILISFDDRRAAAALTALAELSRRTQIIFFTHHTHLVELARQSLSAEVLFVHELTVTGR